MTSSGAHSPSYYRPTVGFDHLFGLVPFPLDEDPDSDIPKPCSSPITFFDRHLDDSLILKRVVVLPSLISTLSDALDDYVSAFNSENESFSSPRLYLSPTGYNCAEPPKNATDIAERYRSTSTIFLQAASTLVVHPDRPNLKTVFRMDKGRPGPPEGFHTQKYSLTYVTYAKEDIAELLESWDLDRKSLVLSMWDHLPTLAIWDMYALSGESMLDDMSGLAALDVFPWKHCGTSGHRQFASSVQVSRPDVSKYLWDTAPIPSGNGALTQTDTIHPRRSERLKGRPSAKGLTHDATPKKRNARSLLVKEPAAPKITVPKSGHGTSRYKENVADFIQRVFISLSFSRTPFNT